MLAAALSCPSLPPAVDLRSRCWIGLGGPVGALTANRVGPALPSFRTLDAWAAGQANEPAGNATT
eukprot:8062284-Pyramimonas_sp.AAC.1